MAGKPTEKTKPALVNPNNPSELPTGIANYARDLEWAYTYQGNDRIERRNAPSDAAFNMLQAVNAEPLKWVKTFADHYSRKGKLAEADTSRIEDRRKQMGYLNMIEGEFKSVQGATP